MGSGVLGDDLPSVAETYVSHSATGECSHTNAVKFGEIFEEKYALYEVGSPSDEYGAS